MNHFPDSVKHCRKEMMPAEVTAYTKAREGDSTRLQCGQSPEQATEVNVKGNRAENGSVLQEVGASGKSWGS